jgi:phosphonate transport system substrate-binding protein
MSKRWTSIVVTLLVVVGLFLTGCGQAKLGTEENPVIWTFVPSQDSEEVLAGAQQIADEVADKTGIIIKTNIATEYAGLIEAMCNGEAHMGALNTFGYVLASERDCAKVAIASVRYGSPFYTGQIVTHVDSGIESLADMAGKTWCRADPLSTSSWIIPSIMMSSVGVDPATDLAQVVDANGHDGVITAVYNGDCDAGATFVDARSNVEDDIGDVKDKVIVIEVSPEIPNDTISFGKDVPAELKEQIITALLEIGEDEEFQEILNDTYSWNGLVAKGDDFYTPFRQILDASDIDISKFLD